MTKISDLRPDHHNANRGTDRGAQAVAESLRAFGAGRSILVDRNGNILAGNTTAKSAIAAGIDEDTIVVESDGSKLVVVMRTDLDINDAKARGLAVADNRASELGLSWDPANLLEFSCDLDLKAFFTDTELSELTVPESGATGTSGAMGAPGPETLEGRYKEQYGVIVICEDEANQRKIYEQLTGQGLECRVVVT